MTITPECINEVMSCKISTTPVVGMLGTMFVGSDRYTVVCLSVKSAKHVKLYSHIPNKFLENRYTKNGVEYIPETDVTTLIEYITPKLENYIKKYGETEGTEVYNDYIKYFSLGTEYSLRKNGRWMPKGHNSWGTSSVHWGYGDNYLDPSF